HIIFRRICLFLVGYICTDQNQDYSRFTAYRISNRWYTVPTPKSGIPTPEVRIPNSSSTVPNPTDRITPRESTINYPEYQLPSSIVSIISTQLVDYSFFEISRIDGSLYFVNNFSSRCD